MGDINLFRRIKTTDRGIEKVQDGISNLAQQARKAINDLKDSVTTTLLTATSAVIGTLTATTGTITTLTSTTSTITTANITTLDADLIKCPITTYTTAEISAAGNDPDITGITVLRTNTGAGNATIDTLVGGVTGQILVILHTGSNTVTITHLGSGSGNFISTDTGADVTLTSTGAAILIFDGTTWFHIAGNT